MPSAVILVSSLLGAMVVAYVVLCVREAQKRRRIVRRCFGKPQPAGQGRREARAYWQAMPGKIKGKNALDEITWGDLDMDDVYSFANGCHSALGDVRLYCALRQPSADPGADLATRRQLMGVMDMDPALRENLQYTLAKLGRRTTADPKRPAFEPGGYPVRRRWLFRCLLFLPLLALPVWVLAGWQNGVLFLLALLALNLQQSYMHRHKAEEAISSLGYLASARGTARQLAKKLEGAAPDAAAELRGAAEGFGKNNKTWRMLAMDEWLTARGVPNPLSALCLPMLSYCKLAVQMPKYTAQALALQTAVGEVDLAAAVLSFRECLPVWCTPVFGGQTELDGEAVYHPLVEQPVANSGRFACDTLFTGSNASGKSTFTKALAINAVLACSIFTCCAARFTLRPGAVATSMAVRDSISEGDSYFVAELKSLRRLMRLAAAGQPAYLFIDEILKGTNTIERIAASTAVLEYLHDTPALCFAATHDIELCELLAGRFENRHFRETVDETGVHFDYVLHQGPARTRNAILLMEQMGFAEGVVKKANGMAAAFGESGRWENIE